MNMDWKDMLSQLQNSGSLPSGEEPAVLEEPTEDASEIAKTQGLIHVVVEKKGRKGKTATIAEGFTCSDDELAELASKLKRKLGVGGSARGGEILIQGECKDRMVALLKELGYRVK